MAQNVVVPPFDAAPVTVVGSTPQAVFPFDFPFWDESDVLVFVNGVQLASGSYGVQGLYVQNGDPVEGGFGSGVVTLNVAVSNVSVMIDRLVTADRESQFSRAAPLGMPALNNDFNKLTARQQDVARLVRRIQFEGLTSGLDSGAARAAIGAAGAAGEGVSAGAFRDAIGAAADDLSDVADAILIARSARTIPFNNLVAFLGDSITAASIDNTTTELRNSNRGPLTWLTTLTGGRFTSRQNLVFGVSGDTAQGALARIGPVIASGAGTCVVEIGTNNIPAGDFTATTTALDGIYKALAAANILIIALPILPRTLATAANYGFANRVNKWIADGAKRYPNFRYVDPFLFGDPYSLTNSPRTGYTYDGLHPVAIGMRYVMKPVCEFLNTLRAPLPRSIRTITDHYVAGVNPTGFVNPNPMMAGTAGTLSSGGSTMTGTAPDSWNLFADAGGGTITGLNVAGSSSTSATGLTCARVEVSGTATGGFQTVVGLNQYNFPGGFSIGDKIQFVVEIELEGGAIGVSGVAAYLQAAGNDKDFSWDARPIVSDDLTVDAYSGLLVTPTLTLTASPTLTSCGVWIFLKNTGTTRAIAVKVVSAAVRRVIE